MWTTDARADRWTVTGATADDEHVPLRNALLGVHPVQTDYASAPVATSFNWEDVLATAHPGRWYLVAFRSRLREGADSALLHSHDRDALGEALASAPGLLVYFAGGFDSDGACLSFCLWTDERYARAARGAPRHHKAVDIVQEMYSDFRLETGHLTKHGDGHITLEMAQTGAPA